jgi:D-beta-D-heptose 7-phosphate kinase/D-beta-D-heptose 1-phosphate adenosyltransferase
MKVGIVSGYFNPLHLGHVQYLYASRERCDMLVAIVNNDKQVKLKGAREFMNEQHRCKIIQSLKPVDVTILSVDTDKSVCNSIRKVKKIFPDDELVFFNSGDRTSDNLNNSESLTCQELNIEQCIINLTKICSSSSLLENIVTNEKKNINHGN